MAEKIATRKAYGEFLAEAGKTNENIMVLDADLSGSTYTSYFAKEFPDRFFNMGIAEQNLMGVAAGMALAGKTVFASSFAMFAAGRAFEIIRNAIAHTGANVKICATHAGVTVGEDGATHQVIEDMAIMRAIPGMTVVNPADAVSAKKLLAQVEEMKGPAYVRLGRAGVPVVYSENDEVVLGKGRELRQGNDGTIIATGIMLDKALQAADLLAADGISARVIDMHTIKPIDEKIIVRAAQETGFIVTAEEHTVVGGLGSAVAEVAARTCPVPVKMVGVNDAFGQSGKPDELLEYYGLTAEHIAAEFKNR